MSTFENPDAAPDATPDEPATTDAQPVSVPPLPETPAAEAAVLADLTPPAAATTTATAETTAVADVEPPAPAALPPAFTGFAAADGAAAPVAPAATTAAPAPAASPAPSGPRVRWAGIVWGLVLAAIAALALSYLTDAARQAAVTDWLLNLSPAAAVAYAVLVVGLFALVAGLVGLVRRAQRGAERRRAASTTPS